MDIKINKTPSGTVRYPRHTHKQYEIMHYLDGKGIMWTEKGEIPFSKETIVIVPPNILHGSVSENGFVNISVEYDFDGLFVLDSPTAVRASENGDGAHLVRMIWENRYKSEAYIHSLCVAYSQYILQKTEINNKMGECVGNIVRRISDNAFDPEINVAELLRQSGYAEDYVRSCFKQRTGKTPVDFLTELRIKRACYLMDIYKDSLSLCQIAEKCGYLDYIYFSKKFKEYTGISPRRYRES